MTDKSSDSSWCLLCSWSKCVFFHDTPFQGSTVFPIHLYKSIHLLKERYVLFSNIENRTAEPLYFMRGNYFCLKLTAKFQKGGCYGAELNSLCAMALERWYPSTLWFLWRSLSSFPPTLIMCLFLRAMTLRRSTFHSLPLPALTSFSYLGYVGLITNKNNTKVQFNFVSNESLLLFPWNLPSFSQTRGSC